MSSQEMQAGHEVVVNINPQRGEIFVNKPGGDEPPKQFTFDMTFDWNSRQTEIYEKCASNIVENVLEGYNGTIFAYG
jgi:kinesin family protein 3/17